MNFTVPLAMFGLLPVGLALFLLMPVRKALVTTYLVGWLFLPQAAYSITGLPDYTRMTAVNLAVLLGTALIDPRGLLRVRPALYDLPMLVWCLSGLPTSISNGLGVYDGISSVVGTTLTWGVPYWIGRVYLADWQSIRMLAVGVFVGGLIYVPFCLWEMRMAPTLHEQVYGFSSSPFHNVVRLGGYRPRVFLHSGLPLGLWMASASMAGLWLWRSRTVKRLASAPVSWLAMTLLITAVLCRSLGALSLMAVAIVALLAVKHLRTGVALLLLFLGPALYVCLRAPQVWYPESLVQLADRISPERAVSLESRLHQEEVLVAKAWQRPAFGWGGYGRNRVYDEKGESEVVTDALWIIIFGTRGLVGLVSLGMVFALPALLLWRHLRTHEWWAPATAPAAVMAVCITMYAGDCLMNAMLNPIYHVMMGSVLGLAVTLAAQRAPRTAPAGRRALVGRRRVAADPSFVQSK